MLNTPAAITPYGSGFLVKGLFYSNLADANEASKVGAVPTEEEVEDGEREDSELSAEDYARESEYDRLVNRQEDRQAYNERYSEKIIQ